MPAPKPAQIGGLHALAVQIFTGTAVLMIGALILMSFALSSLKASRMQSEATEDTLLEITTIESRLIESDRMLSGYVLSADPWYANRFAVIRADLDATMKKLGHSSRNDPVSAAMYRGIAERLALRQQHYDYLAQPAHFNEVARADRSAAARAERNLTGELRGRLWDLLTFERSQRLAEHTDMIREAELSFWIAVGIVGLALLSGALSLYLAGLGPKVGTSTNP